MAAGDGVEVLLGPDVARGYGTACGHGVAPAGQEKRRVAASTSMDRGSRVGLFSRPGEEEFERLLRESL